MPVQGCTLTLPYLRDRGDTHTDNIPVQNPKQNWYAGVLGTGRKVQEPRETEDGPRKLNCESTAIEKYQLLTHNTLNAELNPICYLLALWWAHPILHVSRIKVNVSSSSSSSCTGRIKFCFLFLVSSKWNWFLHLFLGLPMSLRPFGLYCGTCLGILFVSILCMCCSHFSRYAFISLNIYLLLFFSPNTLVFSFI